MEELAKKLSSSLDEQIFLQHTVRKISQYKDHWQVTYKDHQNKVSSEKFDQVISTMPSHKILSIEWEVASSQAGSRERNERDYVLGAYSEIHDAVTGQGRKETLRKPGESYTVLLAHF